MGRWSDVPWRLLLLSSLWGPCCGLENDGCKNHHRQSERVFSVPGDVAMLRSTLLSPTVFNLSAEPYNVTWYRLNSDRPIGNRSGRVLVAAETLWFLNVTVGDAGDYVTVVRTPGQCFRQDTKLEVELPLSQCGRPRTKEVEVHKGVNGLLNCPLTEQISQLQSYGIPYNLTWYKVNKGCERISDGTGRFHYQGSFLWMKPVELVDQGLYTCTLHFSLGGVMGGVSETIDAKVRGDLCELQQIREPANNVVRAALGSNVTKLCRAFVPCEGQPSRASVDVYWLQNNNFISENPSDRIYTTAQRKEYVTQDGKEGWLIDGFLVISELKEQDLNQNYTCVASSDYGHVIGYFTLLRKEPELLVPVTLLLGSCLLLFLLCVSVYHAFKLELVLCFRRTFPTLYKSGPDGKLYDAYVAFPQRCSVGWTQEVETFALLTLPQVLEEACGYSLFIPDRDSLPGQAVMEAVEENLKWSRRILLLYTASTFSNKYCSNNNTLLSRPPERPHTNHHTHTSEDHNTHTTKDHHSTSEDHHSQTTENQPDISENHLNTSKDLMSTTKVHFSPGEDHTCDRQGCEGRCGHARSQLECVVAMHSALMERSVKVILVELEELGPSEVERLPQSLRHLRQTQGAVCWWRSRGAAGTPWRSGCRRGTGGTGDTETAPSSCLSPDCRFWKEVRYRMPVKGKRRSPPEATALLPVCRTGPGTQRQQATPL